MNSSRLRHDLRTPLNHIVGYCQLLLEEAEAEAQGPGAAWVQPVQRVSELARQLSKILETLVSSTSPPDLDKLRGALKQPVQEISEALRSIHLSEDSAQSADVRRLLQATGKLSHFIGTGSLAQTTASSEPDTYQEVLTTLDHLLVVDDDHANRDLLGRMLTRLNYRVSTAADGAEGLDLLNKNDFDLVL